MESAIRGMVSLVIGAFLLLAMATVGNFLSGRTDSVGVGSSHTASILAFGDMMLDRNVRLRIEKNGPEYPFAPLVDFLKGNDIVVANAEGAFTDNASVTAGVKNAPLVFTFDPVMLLTLKNLGFTLLSQANNHSYNFGADGLRQSENNIEKAGMEWFGDPLNVDVGPRIVEIGGQKIAFIGYHQFAAGGFGRTLSAIRSARTAGAFTIVYPHWGTEYATGTTDIQKEYAHAFIDAGADAVLGSHPHVVEPIEIYQGKAIFYSLGNFIFDQWAGPTAEGLAVRIVLAPQRVFYKLFPIAIFAGQASLMPSPDATLFLNDLSARSMALPEVVDGIGRGGFSLAKE